MILASLFVGAFLIGSIPFGFLAARAKGIDIRKVGSGNIGATNVNRALGWKAALAVFALDVLKGVVPTLVARLLVTEPFLGLPPEVWCFMVGLASMLGHIFSPWLGFKGGKGIATGLGVIIISAPIVAGIALLLFIVSVAATGYVSVGSIVAATSLPIVGWLVPGQPREMVWIFAAAALFLDWKHRANVARLIRGEEPKFAFKKPQQPAPEGEQDSRSPDP